MWERATWMLTGDARESWADPIGVVIMPRAHIAGFHFDEDVGRFPGWTNLSTRADLLDARYGRLFPVVSAQSCKAGRHVCRARGRIPVALGRHGIRFPTAPV